MAMKNKAKKAVGKMKSVTSRTKRAASRGFSTAKKEMKSPSKKKGW